MSNEEFEETFGPSISALHELYVKHGIFYLSVSQVGEHTVDGERRFSLCTNANIGDDSEMSAKMRRMLEINSRRLEMTGEVYDLSGCTE